MKRRWAAEKHAFKHWSNKSELYWLTGSAAKPFFLKKKEIWEIPKYQQCCLTLVLYGKESVSTCFRSYNLRKIPLKLVVAGFTASNVWLKNWKARHKSEVNSESEILKGYELKDIWNVDETGLAWRELPDKMLSVLVLSDVTVENMQRI